MYVSEILINLGKVLIASRKSKNGEKVFSMKAYSSGCCDQKYQLFLSQDAINIELDDVKRASKTL